MPGKYQTAAQMQQDYALIRATRQAEERAARRRRQQRAARQLLSRPGITVPVRQIRMNAGEKKGVDTSIEVTGPIISTTNTNGDSFVLNLIQTGNGSWNRVGKKVFLKSLRLKGIATVVYNPEATSGNLRSAVLRMVIVWDKQPSGAAIPNFDTIFGHTNQSGTEATTMMDQIKYDNMGRFKILRDVTIESNCLVLNTSGAGTQNTTIQKVAFDEYLKLGNKVTIFSGQSNPMTIADISTGGLYVYFRADASANDDSDWAIADVSYARLRYSD